MKMQIVNSQWDGTRVGLLRFPLFLPFGGGGEEMLHVHKFKMWLNCDETAALERFLS